jgi:hypothetical protein
LPLHGLKIEARPRSPAILPEWRGRTSSAKSPKSIRRIEGSRSEFDALYLARQRALLRPEH